MNIEGRICRLRALEPSDLDVMYGWENDTDVWRVSGTLAPFSRHVLSRLIDEQQFDIYATRQMRLVIESLNGTAVGAVDMFEGPKFISFEEGLANGMIEYIGQDVIFGIRPEAIHDEPSQLANNPDSQLDAYVDVTELMGAEIYLYLTYKDTRFTARVEPTTKSRTGDTIKIALDTNRVHLFDPETELTILN